MRTLAIISLDTSELRTLNSIWKFFAPLPGLRIVHLAATPRNGMEALSFLSVEQFIFTGGTAAACRDIAVKIASLGDCVICFASLASRRIWDEFHGLKSIDLFVGRQRSYALLPRSQTDMNDYQGQVLQNFNAVLGVLAGEELSLGAGFAPRRFEDFCEYQRDGDGWVLITGNADLISAVCLRELNHFNLLHLYSDSVSCDVAMDGEAGDYLVSYYRLSQIALVVSAADVQTVLPDKLRENQPIRSLNSYSLFAEYYDNYMEHVNYDDWVSRIQNWYKYWTRAKLTRVLEIACGTANASEIMVFRGCEVDACDSSPHMLHIADAKEFKPNLFLCSMTDPLPLKDYDLIFCLFDSINYLTHKADVRALLNNVKASLRPGGVFIFDISTLANSVDNFNGTVNFTRVRDGQLIHISNFEPLTNRQITAFSLFRRNGQVFDKFEERHVQRVYRCQELIDLVPASGLMLRAIHSPEHRANLISRPGQESDNRHHRLFFILQKPDEPTQDQ